MTEEDILTTTLRDVPTPQLLCMRGAFGHEWDEITKPYRIGQWGHRFHALCVRCGKERTTIFNIYGIEAAHYYETPGWHIKVDEPFDSADVRLEMMRRLKTEGVKQGKTGEKQRAHLRSVG